MPAITASAPRAIQMGSGDWGVVVAGMGGNVVVGIAVVAGTVAVVVTDVGGSTFTILK